MTHKYKELEDIDSKLRRIEKVQMPNPNMSSHQLIRIVDAKVPTHYSLKEEEIKKIIDTVSKSKDLVLIVQQGAMGFSPKYVVVDCFYPFVGIDQPLCATILSIEEKQLPKKWDFEKLSKTFNSTENLRKIDFFKQEIPRAKSSYYY